MHRGQKWSKTRMQSIPNPFSANIRESYEKNERLKEERDTVDLYYADDIFLLARRFCDMNEKLKRVKEEAELAGLYININKTEGNEN